VVTTGYGRETIGLSDASATEITCHAKGAHFLFPQARTVIDIGGQDSKVIRIDERGNVVNFVMNDKCAAGTGRFLDMMAKTLELTLPEMSELGLAWKNEVTISSMCTVFAESEVVSLVADNTAPEDIIHGLNASVAGKTASLVKRLGGEPAYIMTGGVAQNKGVVKELSDKLGAEVHVPQEAQLCGAIGAALLAFEER
jgi:predicted CoA-substrate-specific enzyme activase